MVSVCQENFCCGCSACVSICPKGAIQLKDNKKNIVSKINESKCINCNLCRNVCPVNYPVQTKEPIQWYQGWAKDDILRSKSSSGGAARCLTEKFISDGGEVCSCTFENGEFQFSLVDDLKNAGIFAGSKYVKSNPGMIYGQIKKDLVKGKKVLFIGLPCQVAGVLNYCRDKVDNLYTVDLICHGTPSVKLLNQFFKEHGYKLSELSTINFRDKNVFALNEDVKFTKVGEMDRYSIAFLTGSCYTENCYKCAYAKKERISDITIGDSWGSELVQEESKGISLLLCQTEKGKKLVESLDFNLASVDLEKAIAYNRQLNTPSKRPVFLEDFYKDLESGKKFNKIIFKYCKVKCIKQMIKSFLIKAHLLKVHGGYRVTGYYKKWT